MRNAWDSDPSVRPKFLEIMTRMDAMAERNSSTTGQGSWTTSSGTGGHASVLGSHVSTNSDSSRSSDKGHRAGQGARAPVGEVTIVFSDIVRAMALWEHNPEAMKDATLAHNSLLRSSLLQFGGYEVSFFKFTLLSPSLLIVRWRIWLTLFGAFDNRDGNNGEGSMCSAFQTADNALEWCMHVQSELLRVDWPAELLAHPAAAEEWGDIDDRIIYKVHKHPALVPLRNERRTDVDGCCRDRA
jgi:hypothetical protein